MRLSPHIVSAMQDLTVEQRRILGPRAPWHVGDIAWGARRHEEREDEWHIRLWVADGRPVAWSWLRLGGRDGLDHDVHPDHVHLLDEILREPRARVAFAFEDDHELRESLAAHGFTQPGDPLQFLVRDLDAPPEPCPLRDGFSHRVAGDADLPNGSRSTATCGRRRG